jgi:hypothetical protein
MFRRTKVEYIRLEKDLRPTRKAREAWLLSLNVSSINTVPEGKADAPVYMGG